MRKKYLSALLFGALLVTSAGTFTSCKDYDDDINNLQEQIDKLATKEDMEAKLSQMQTAIDAAKKTAEDALAKAEAAGDSEEINDLKDRIAALEEAMKKVETLKAEIKDMVDGELADFRKEMQEFMKEVEELTGYSLTMVTGISFVYNEPNAELSPALSANFARVNTINIPNESYTAGNQDQAGSFKSAGASYVFGKDLTGAFTINVKDVNTVADNMLVKLDPVDAVVSSDMLSLINGKGEDLNAYVDMTVEPWSDNITSSTRATANTGLYKVGVQLKNDVDFEAFDKMVLPNPGNHNWTNCNGHEYNMFALAVSDPEKSRAVTSDYNVSLHVQEEKEAVNIPTYTYVVSIGTNNATSSKAIKDYATGGDEDKNCIEVKLGSSFDLLVGSEYNDAEDPKGGRVMASYVVVDINNKALSSTDKAAINGLTITGVDEVSKTLKHTLSINGASGVAVPMKLVTIDYTGKVKENIFWVKAGEGIELSSAFTITPVQYIDNPTAWPADELVDLEKADLQEFTIPTGTISGRLDMIIGEADNKPNKYSGEFNNIVGVDGKLTSGEITVNSTKVIQLYTANKTKAGAGTPIKDVAYAAFIGTMNLQSMREDKAYEGTIKFYGEEGDDYVGARMISVTKKLPTDVPAGFSAKTNTIVNGVMTVYPTPLNGELYYLNTGNATIAKTGKDVDGKDYTLGYFDLLESFNGWSESTNIVGFGNNWALGNGYSLAVKDITDKNVANNITDPKTFASYTERVEEGSISKGQISSIRPSIIGNGEAYESTVKYNYGNIKYVPVGHGVDANANHTVEWSKDFNMKFGHWIKDSKFQWTLDENPVVTYGVENMIYGKVTKTTGTDGTEKVTSVENVIEVIAPNGDEINPFEGANTNKWLTYANKFGNGLKGNPQNVTIILKTVGEDGTERTNEFFTAEFATGYYTTGAPLSTTLKLTPVNVSESTTVGNDVETKVYFKFTDKFNVEHNIHALTFTMKYKKN